MITGFLNLPWFLWAVLAFVVAVVYSFVWPHKNLTLNAGFHYFMLRWGHALAWVLLAVNFLLRGLEPSLNELANIAALAGGLMYLLFLVMTFLAR